MKFRVKTGHSKGFWGTKLTQHCFMQNSERPYCSNSLFEHLHEHICRFIGLSTPLWMVLKLKLYSLNLDILDFLWNHLNDKVYNSITKILESLKMCISTKSWMLQQAYSWKLYPILLFDWSKLLRLVSYISKILYCKCHFLFLSMLLCTYTIKIYSW